MSMATSSTFSLSFESTIANMIQKGMHVAIKDGYVTFDDRLLQKALIRRSTHAKDVIILGSSTTMQVRESHFPGETFFNHSVRRGVLEDYLAIYQMYREQELKPKRILVGIDSWIFDPRHWKQYWLSLSRELLKISRQWQLGLYQDSTLLVAYKRAVRDISAIGQRDIWCKLRSLASLYIGAEPLFFETATEETGYYLKRSDGSVRYHASFENRSEEAVTQIIRDSVKFPRYLIASAYVDALETFVTKVVMEGVQIAFYIPPHHPEFYRLEHGNSKGERVVGWQEFVESLVTIERFVHEMAARVGARVYGSFKPDRYSAASSEYYDWIHAKESLVRRVLETPQ